MFEKTSQCIANCFNTLNGTHVLYRSYGLNEVDAANMPIRRDIVVQLSTYYPQINLSELTLTYGDLAGKLYYTVTIKGE